MKRLHLPFLIFSLILTGCLKDSNNKDISVSEMEGLLHVSLEELSFTRHGKEYYVIDKNGLLKDFIQEARSSQQNFNVDKMICIKGYEESNLPKDKKGFGPLEKYSRAIVVESLCAEL